jgi:hypothetical protein
MEEFFGGRMLYIIIKGHWCDIIVLNVHALRIKMMIQSAKFMKDYNVYLNNSRLPDYQMNPLHTNAK